MIRITATLCILLAAVSLSAQNYSNDVEALSETDNTATVRSSGIHAKKKEAAEMAAKSAFYSFFFTGIPGLNNNKPLLKPEDEKKHRDYFERFFTAGRYRNFIREVSVMREEKSGKDYKATVRMEFNKELLLRDIEINKLLSKSPERASLEETGEQIMLPTIMVVPYKTDGQSYSKLLHEDFDKRTAVGKVQDAFNREGVTTVDLEARINATQKAMLFESNSVESFDKQLIRNSGADIYVTVDMHKETGGTGSRVTLSLKAYETSTANILSVRQKTSNRFRTDAIDQLILHVLDDITKDFLKDISTAFAHKENRGNSIVLNISIDPSATLDLETEVGPDSYPLSDLLRLWVKKNAVQGRYHVQGSVETAIIFDQIQIPVKDENGGSVDTNDFAFSIWEYLRSDLNIACKRRVDGNTIYITITE